MSTNPTNPFSIAGEVALITGGGSGIGFAIARSLAGAGARVVLAGRRKTVIAAAAAEIGPAATAIDYDVNNVEAAPALVQRVEQTVGAVSILVNNAGIHLKKSALQTSSKEFFDVMATHVFGAHALTRAVAAGMIERRRGSVVFIASMASLFGIPQVVAYSAAKTAILGMVRSLTVEFAPHGIRVNAVAPGWIDTDMSRGALAGDAPRLKKILERTPMARLGSADDVGNSVLYLVSPAAAFVTGVVLPVDGGASIGF